MIHSPDCDCDAYACRLRAKGVQVSAGAATSTRRGKPDSNARYNAWERGIFTVERPDGSRMPVLNEKGTAMRMKEASERRHEIEAMQRRQAAALAN